MDAEKLTYERLLSHAREQKDNQLVARVEAIIPKLDADYPEREKSYVENCALVRRELSRLAGETLMHHLSWDDRLKTMAFDQLISPHLTLTDLSNAKLGDDIAAFRPPYTFAKDFYAIDLPNDVGSSFEVPIFFFTGAHDWQTPRLLSDNWFRQINAPYKELIHFEESSHMIVNEQPGKVLMALVNKVLPCAQAETGREANNV
jgi:pimeloyl-ACP methyl ester carboxylesterase